MKWELIVLIVFDILFLIFGCLDSYGCYKENRKMHLIFKCFPLAILTILSVIIYPSNYFVWLGFLFCFFGDLFILIGSKKLFYVGASSFFIGHCLFSVFYTLLIYNINKQIPMYVIIGIPSILLLFAIVFVIVLYKKVKLQSIAMGLYYAILFVNLFLAISYAITSHSLYFIITIVGYCFFVFSDVLIGLRQYKITLKHGEFAIISSYFVAQLLISIGILLDWILFKNLGV